MSAVEKARALGHSMVPSKRPLASNVTRHECIRCGAAAIDYGDNSYGLATEMACQGSRVA